MSKSSKKDQRSLVWSTRDIRSVILVIIGAFVASVGIKYFVETQNLMPSGFNGLAWLIVRVANEFFNIKLSFSIIYFVINFIPAMFFYMAFIVLALGRGIRKARKEGGTGLSAPLACAVAGYAVQAMFNISVVPVAPVFWIFLGVLCGNGTFDKL